MIIMITVGLKKMLNVTVLPGWSLHPVELHNGDSMCK